MLYWCWKMGRSNFLDQIGPCGPRPALVLCWKNHYSLNWKLQDIRTVEQTVGSWVPSAQFPDTFVDLGNFWVLSVSDAESHKKGDKILSIHLRETQTAHAWWSNPEKSGNSRTLCWFCRWLWRCRYRYGWRNCWLRWIRCNRFLIVAYEFIAQIWKEVFTLFIRISRCFLCNLEWTVNKIFFFF